MPICFAKSFRKNKSLYYKLCKCILLTLVILYLVDLQQGITFYGTMHGHDH